jgi:hypothetical protein
MTYNRVLESSRVHRSKLELQELRSLTLDLDALNLPHQMNHSLTDVGFMVLSKTIGRFASTVSSKQTKLISETQLASVHGAVTQIPALSAQEMPSENLDGSCATHPTFSTRSARLGENPSPS